MDSVFKAARFHNEASAYAALEAIMWPEGPVCPFCHKSGRINRLEGVRTKASKKHPEGKVILGLWKCYKCRKKFTVRKGTVFEASHLELHQWLQAAFLMCSSKKGVSANQLHRTLGCTLKTAWFAAHRLREAMRQGALEPMGGAGKVIEADETWTGTTDKAKAPAHKVQGGYGHKRAILSLIERGGHVRSFHIEKANAATIKAIVEANVSRESRFMTDTAAWYRKGQMGFERHQMVNHYKGEYVRYENVYDFPAGKQWVSHVNSAEGYFSLFKKGLGAVYQHCAEKNLHRYLSEFDFRYNHRVALGVNDEARTIAALRSAKGKRLTYKAPRAAE
jgi:transposase-like protein